MLLAVVLAHGWALWRFVPASQALTIEPPRPIWVSLVQAPQPAPEPPAPVAPPPPPQGVAEPPPPKPKPKPKPARKPPERAITPPAPPEPPAVPVVLASPTPTRAEAPRQAPRIEPEPVRPPHFDADYLDNPKPAYPRLSRRLGEQGRVLLRVYVNADGGPAQIEIARSSGHERLDSAAQEAVRGWQFAPARQGDRALAAWVVVPIVFSLEG